METAFGTNVAAEPFIVTTNLPVIMDAQPRSGPQGTVVTLTGALFAGVTEVRFNGVRPGFISTEIMEGVITAVKVIGHGVVASPEGTMRSSRASRLG